MNLRFPIFHHKPHPTTIPWNLVELAYSVYAAEHGQVESLKELVASGRFSPDVMDSLVPYWREMCDEVSYLNPELIKAQIKIKQLTEILEKLPKTADGVPLTVGMKVWEVDKINIFCYFVPEGFVASRGWTECYSTYELAQTAQDFLKNPPTNQKEKN